jgi:hypothetical protein
MMGIREFIKTPAGKVTVIAFLCLAIALAIWSALNSLDPSQAAARTSDRIFICAETGKAFNYTIKLGDKPPVKSPYSGKNTGYEAERCYWTADGKPKADPTPVLLKSAIGQEGPTFCPDCGRLVVGNNPVAIEGVPPPPTEAEYQSSRSPRASR